MIRVVVVAVLVLALVWLAYEFARARRRRKAFLATRDSRGRPMLPPHQRVTDEQLHAKARTLRKAVDSGHISVDEAVGSLMRYSGNVLTEQQAHQLLDG